jgi:hypothetical protein
MGKEMGLASERFTQRHPGVLDYLTAARNDQCPEEKTRGKERPELGLRWEETAIPGRYRDWIGSRSAVISAMARGCGRIGLIKYHATWG